MPGLIRYLLCTVVLLATQMALVAQGGQGLPERGSVNVTQPAATGGQAPHGEHAGKSTMQMENNEFFTEQFAHLVPHVLFEPELSPAPEVNNLFKFYDVNLFQLIGLGLVALIFLLVLASFRSGGQSSWVVRVFRGWAMWIRDEMVYPIMGKEHGQAFVPYFIFVFFFVASMNVIGLIPGSKTATATVFVTGALALITLILMLFFGMREQGVVGYWKGLLPHGLPAWLLPLMAVVELVGVIVKPFALMIRLFANMLGGHLVLYSFIGMIFLFAKMMSMGTLSWATAVPSFGMAVFIYIIEAFVALLQAYIFTYLSIIFVQQAIHPAH